MVTLIIGEGSTSQLFSEIDWSNGEYFLRVEIDPLGGIDYSIEQSSQLLSVPYALYAANASNVDLDKNVEGILPVSSGGTGSTTAPFIGVVTAPSAEIARQILGINSNNFGGDGTKLVLTTVENNYLSLKDSAVNDDEQELSAGIVPISLGGTGSSTAPMVGLVTAADAADARSVIGTGSIATQNIDAVDVDGGAIDGTVIGASAPSTGIFTSVNSGLIQSVGDTDIIIKTGNNTTGTITLANGADGDIKIIPNGTGKVTVGDIIFPASDGTANQILKTDGSGNLSFTDQNVSTPVTLATVTDNYLTISGQEITAGKVPVALGGTGSTTAPMVGVITAADAAQARIVLGVDVSGTDSSTSVTLATVTDNYLTISGQEITAGKVPISLGGTGSTTAPMVGVITAADAAEARTAIGTGSIATQNSDAVDVDGGAIDGTVIGATAPSTGIFTSVNSGLIQSVGDTDIIIKTGNNNTGTITLNNGSNGNINISPNGTGKVVMDNVIVGATDGDQVIDIASHDLVDGGLKLGGTLVTSSAAELNVLDGVTSTSTELNYNDITTLGNSENSKVVTQSSAGVITIGATDGDQVIDIASHDLVDGGLKLGGTLVTSSAAELNVLDGVTSTSTELNYNDITTLGNSENSKVVTQSSAGVITIGATDGDQVMDIASHDLVDGGLKLGGTLVTSSAAELNVLDGVTSSAAELNVLDGVTSSVAELNVLDGSTTQSTLTLQGSDGIIISDSSDSEIMKQALVSDFATYIGAGASSIDGLSDALIEDNSIYMGNDPSSTTNSAENNTALGLTALDAITTGDKNVAIGYDALTANTEGSENVAVGRSALATNTSGANNVSIGNESLSGNTQGSRNTAVGFKAMFLNETGQRNVAFGYNTGRTGSYNASFGYSSLASVTGNNNTALGYEAGNIIGGNTLTSGTDNVIIGHTATVDDSDAINRIVIGKGASGLDDNTVTLGNGSITNWLPTDDSEVDLGSSSKEMKDIYVDGVAYTDAIGFGTTAFTLPTSAGSDGQILAKASGANTLEWVNNSGVAGGINELSDAVINGGDNSSVGLGTSLGNGVGRRNVGVGIGSLSSLTGDAGDVWSDAINNTAVGYNALNSLTAGVQNTIMGAENSGNLTGDKNVVIGAQAGLNLSTANRNTIIGYRSVEQLTTGDYNTIIGDRAAQSTADAQNQIVIGSTATGQGNNYAVIGNASVSRLYAAQDGAAVIYANGTINSSDLRFKTKIKPVELGLQFIKKLNPVSYYKISKSQYKGEEDNNESRYEYGLIAQEVEDILKESDSDNSIIVKDDEGFYGMDYKQITMPLIKAVQEQEKTIETLKKVNEDLVQRLEAIEKLLLK